MCQSLPMTTTQNVPSAAAARIAELRAAYAAVQAVHHFLGKTSDPYFGMTADAAYRRRWLAERDVRAAISRARAPHVVQAYFSALRNEG